MKPMPKTENAKEPREMKMKTKLFLAIALSVLAANTFAADGYDRTGSAVAADGYTPHFATSPSHDRTGSATVAAGWLYDRTGGATVAEDG